MSRSRARDELTPENFTQQSVQSLEGINHLFELKGDSLERGIDRCSRYNSRLKKQIQNLRIFFNKFWLNLVLSL